MIFDNYHAASRVQGTRNVNFEGCTFEAFSAASIDWSGASLSSDNVTPASGYSHITGCTFKGDGNINPWCENSVTIEKGAGYITVNGNTFYRGFGGSVQIEDTGGYNTISNNTIDSTNNVLNTGITHDWIAWIGITSNHNTVTGNSITGNGTPDHVIKLNPGASYNSITGNTLINGGVYNNSGNSTNVIAPNVVR